MKYISKNNMSMMNFDYHEGLPQKEIRDLFQEILKNIKDQNLSQTHKTRVAIKTLMNEKNWIDFDLKEYFEENNKFGVFIGTMTEFKTFMRKK